MRSIWSESPLFYFHSAAERSRSKLDGNERIRFWKSFRCLSIDDSAHTYQTKLIQDRDRTCIDPVSPSSALHQPKRREKAKEKTTTKNPENFLQKKLYTWTELRR